MSQSWCNWTTDFFSLSSRQGSTSISTILSRERQGHHAASEPAARPTHPRGWGLDTAHGSLRRVRGVLSGLPAQVPPRVRGFKETSRVSCGSRALGRHGELSDSCSDDLKGKRCMCSPAARTASQGAPRSAGKGVLPVGPGGPYAWRDAAWRVAGPEGSGRWPNTQC